MPLLTLLSSRDVCILIFQ